MKSFHQLSFTVVVAFSLIQFCLVRSYYQGSRNSIKSSLIAKTITVDLWGHGDFTTIQGAINSVPSKNNWWICIHVNPGFYREKIYIGKEKPFIYLEGSGMEKTVIVYNEAIQTRESATFVVMADNFVAKWITFKVTISTISPTLVMISWTMSPTEIMGRTLWIYLEVCDQYQQIGLSLNRGGSYVVAHESSYLMDLS